MIELSVDRPRTVEPFTFTGDGREYFRIWIVNLVLSIATLGVYSAWAKGRRTQYFYRHTHVDGLAAFALLAVVLPWLLVRSFRFRLHITSYRGIRFAFRGPTTRAYAVFLGLPVLTMLTLFLLAPFSHHRIKTFQIGHVRFGQEHVMTRPKVSEFYLAYLAAGFLSGFLVVGAVIIVGILYAVAESGSNPLESQAPVLNTAAMAVLLLVYACAFTTGQALVAARTSNEIWSNTWVGTHGFVSSIGAWPLFRILFANLALTLVTLGLYRVHLPQKRLNLAHRQAARVERDDLVIQPREPPLMLPNQLRLKRALAIARDLNRHRPIVGEHRLPAPPVAMIGRLVRFGRAGRIAEVMAELGAQRPFDNGFLEAPHQHIDVGRRHWAVGRNLIQNLGRNRCQNLSSALFTLQAAGHRDSSSYASHTKFLTRSCKQILLRQFQYFCVSAST